MVDIKLVMMGPTQGKLFHFQEKKSERANSKHSSIDPNELAAYLRAQTANILTSDELQETLGAKADEYPYLFFKGDSTLLKLPVVSVVGTRAPSKEGQLRAKKVAQTLVKAGIVVMSGLAKGIDTLAHQAALDSGGKTIAVLGTPIHKIYPAENKDLALDISKKGLLISPAMPHEEKGRYLFPRRNRLMALISTATVIIEAGETSGVVHQAAECLRQGRKLILLKSLAENMSLSWPKGFIKSGALVIDSADELLAALK